MSSTTVYVLGCAGWPPEYITKDDALAVRWRASNKYRYARVFMAAESVDAEIRLACHQEETRQANLQPAPPAPLRAKGKE